MKEVGEKRTTGWKAAEIKKKMEDRDKIPSFDQLVLTDSCVSGIRGDKKHNSPAKILKVDIMSSILLLIK